MNLFRKTRIVIVCLLAIFVGYYLGEKARREKTLTERFPLTAKGRPIEYWGEFNMGMYTLINRIVGPLFLPSRLDGEAFIKQIEDAVKQYPIAGKDFKLDNNKWQPRFRLWFKKFNECPLYTPMGIEAFRTTIVASANRVVNLLRFYTENKVYDLSEEEAFQKIEKIIFIVGNYRTGTTFMHRLLSANENAISFQQWMLATDGINVKSYKEVINHDRVLDSSIPNPWTSVAEESGKLFFGKHEFKFNKAEEDGLYWASDFFLVPGFEMHEAALFPDRKEYFDFLDQTKEIFEDFFNVRLKLILKCWLSQNSPIWTVFNPAVKKHHLVLKTSFYNFRLDLVKKQFPNSIIVAAHRNQVDMARSYLDLTGFACTLYFKSGTTFQDLTPRVIDTLESHAKTLVKYKDLIDVNLNFQNDVIRDAFSGISKVLDKANIAFKANATIVDLYSNEIARTTMAEAAAKKLQRMKYGANKEVIDVSVGFDVKKEVEKNEVFKKYEEVFKAFLL